MENVIFILQVYKSLITLQCTPLGDVRSLIYGVYMWRRYVEQFVKTMFIN